MIGRTRKKGKSRDARPARTRYWARRILEKRKIRNIQRNLQRNPDGSLMSTTEARDWWRARRIGRTPDK